MKDAANIKKQPDGWRTTRRERFSYIVGDLGRTMEGYIVTAMMSTFLIFQGIDLKTIAGVMLVVKIVDAFDDVIFGYLVDRIKIQKWTKLKRITGEGKYLPWYRLTFLLFPIFTALFFFMPSSLSNTGKLVWFVIFYLLYDLSYTMVEVPANSMIITLTDQLDERNSLLQAKTIVGGIAIIGAGIVWMVMISEYVGVPIKWVALVSSVLFLIMMLPLAFGVREHNAVLANVDPAEEEKYTFKDMWICIKTNKYLMLLMLSTVITSCLATGGAVGNLVSYYHFGSSLVMIIPIAIAFIPQLIAQLQTRKLANKFGKLKVFMACGIMGAAIQLCIYFVGPVFWLCCTLLVIQAPFSNVSNVAKSFFLPDTIEYTRYKTGKDCSGICNALSSFVTKLTTSVSASLGLFILGLSNYIPVSAESFEDIKAAGVSQPDQAMDCMWLIYAMVPMVGVLLGVAVMGFYKLKDKDVELMARCNAGEISREECEALLSGNAARASGGQGRRTPAYFSKELRPGLYLIGIDMGGEGVDATAIIPGHATSNAYMIVGRERALLIDSMGDIPGYRAFAEALAGVPVMLALSHGHGDHTVRLKEFDEFWMHRDDEPLLHGHFGMPACTDIPKTIHYLEPGDVLDLGGRFVDVFNIKGHSRGSLLFLDRQTKTLISGDTIARRLLYGLDGWTPLEEFAAAIMAMEALDFNGILSAHDRIFLPKSHIAYMVKALGKVCRTTPRITLLGREFLQVVLGDEMNTEYQDITIPADYLSLLPEQETHGCANS